MLDMYATPETHTNICAIKRAMQTITTLATLAMEKREEWKDAAI
jgi:hypothetical protein